ncbi:MAG: FAD-binding oxidoreductase [Cyanobacteria bacterium REEB459]|nr:FAD-binding oxidoreductase [Cyanobacteria bacterium REEB459]
MTCLSELMLEGLPGHPLQALAKADQLWHQYRSGPTPQPPVIQVSPDRLSQVDWDVIIAGGTLGLLLAVALVQRGWRVALVERGQLRGRDQEWNISRRELETLVQLGILHQAELEQAIYSEYNPGRIQFLGSDPIWVRDVLNVGVSPAVLLDQLKTTFLAAGGYLLEQTPFTAATIHPNGVQVQARPPLSARLLVDAMGHTSPMVRQARAGQKPDGICLVVGTCATGFEPNTSGDLLVSFTPLRHQCQYFWEAFPARDGRTTYLFTYLDADPRRLTLSQLFEDYWQLLPDYQGVALADLKIKRALFGCFPCYRQSPLRYPWGRTLAVGDSSGQQSPLSFGGFGAMVRHLHRLTSGIDEALTWDCLGSRALGQLQAYQPNLAVTWLFQRAMGAGVDQVIADQHINTLLGAIFSDMAGLGPGTLTPFLQDIVQFPALTRVLLTTAVNHPGLIAQIIPQVGLDTLVKWLGHYGSLASYSGLASLTTPLTSVDQILPPLGRYYLHRWIDALRYGSGQDYHRSHG